MPTVMMRKLAAITLAVFLMVGFLLVDTSAQKRKRKRQRTRRPAAPRIINPEIYQLPPADNTNSEGAGDTSNNNSNSNVPATSEDPESMRKTIRTLSNQVDKLNDKLSQMEESQRSLVDLERLSRAEQRSAQLRAELRELQTKKGELEAHLEDVEYALRPENIERAMAGYGTTRPEDLREQRRRQLESEKERVRKQLDQMRASEDRLHQAIATSETEVERLQKKLDAADRTAIENTKSREASPQPSPTPTPNP